MIKICIAEQIAVFPVFPASGRLSVYDRYLENKLSSHTLQLTPNALKLYQSLDFPEKYLHKAFLPPEYHSNKSPSSAFRLNPSTFLIAVSWSSWYLHSVQSWPLDAGRHPHPSICHVWHHTNAIGSVFINNVTHGVTCVPETLCTINLLQPPTLLAVSMFSVPCLVFLLHSHASFDWNSFFLDHFLGAQICRRRRTSLLRLLC